MKLIYKGTYKSEDQLPKADLPENAVRFDEPESAEELIRRASWFGLPVVAMLGLFVLLSALISGRVKLNFLHPAFFGGMVLFLPAMLPHELLHAVCFGKNAEVELYTSLKNLMLFVVCTKPIKKGRFILMSLLPNLVLGVLPLFVWVVLPYHEVWSNALFAFSAMALFGGVGDYLNVYNALRQMPKGSVQQLSGFHSYWYLPKKDA